MVRKRIDDGQRFIYFSRMNDPIPSTALPPFTEVEPRFPEDSSFFHDYQTSSGETFRLSMISDALLPTRFGEFRIIGFFDTQGGREHTAIIRGNVQDAEEVPLRIHSECHTGDVFGSLRCDCRDQLESALTYIGKVDRGAVLYLRQEGRGIGLLNKIQAYRLQDHGRDTIQANEELGLPAEAREYGEAVAMMKLLGIQSVALMTNNPAKMDGLSKLGFPISRRIPVVIEPNPHNARYLGTKRLSMGHLI